jgi:phosphoribosylaminoimidazole-succinocarboxamide synthase
VLNQTAAWWFANTRHIIDNAVLDVPDPNITVMKKCSVFPVEFVVRGFMTGGPPWTYICDVFVTCLCGKRVLKLGLWSTPTACRAISGKSSHRHKACCNGGNNAVLDVPDPNITVMKKCNVFPVEFVVRGFMTGGLCVICAARRCISCVLGAQQHRT